jgi:hypothetical protein
MRKENTLNNHQAFKTKEQVNSDIFFLPAMEKLSLSPFLFYFADYLGDQFGDGSFSLKLFLLYLAVKTQEGHLRSSIDPSNPACLKKIKKEMESWARENTPDSQNTFDEPIQRMLENIPSLISSNPRIFGKGEDNKPVIISGSFYYLHKYYHFEKRIIQALEHFLSSRKIFFSEEVQKKALELVYRHHEHTSPFSLNERQKNAIRLALEKKILIVTGGPGTGKTTLVITLLRALLHAHVLENGKNAPPYLILLAAPTGRAADRLMESLHTISSLPSTPDIREKEIDAMLPSQAFTLHRILQEGLWARKEGKQKKLICDVMIVDEASMIDTGQMAILLESIPEKGKLILIGDRNQLPSVESGTILADLLPRENEAKHRLSPCSVELIEMNRSVKQIGALANAVNRGDADLAFSLMQEAEGKERHRLTRFSFLTLIASGKGISFFRI